MCDIVCTQQMYILILAQVSSIFPKAFHEYWYTCNPLCCWKFYMSITVHCHPLLEVRAVWSPLKEPWGSFVNSRVHLTVRGSFESERVLWCTRHAQMVLCPHRVIKGSLMYPTCPDGSLPSSCEGFFGCNTMIGVCLTARAMMINQHILAYFVRTI